MLEKFCYKCIDNRLNLGSGEIDSGILRSGLKHTYSCKVNSLDIRTSLEAEGAKT